MPQAYFPPLDKCLSGEERLLSWKIVHQTLCDPIRAVEEAALEAFLSDSESIAVLTSSLDPSPSPSAKSKTEYETKTAPINVSQSSSTEYNLEELKKDALWLSDKLKIEELVALRVVVLEWQSRSEDSLRKASATIDNGFLPNGREVLGHSLSSNNGAKPTTKNADGEQTRRNRQLAIFLEEKSYALQTTAELMELTHLHNHETTSPSTWLHTIASMVATGLGNEGEASEHDAFCARCIHILGTLIEKANHASSWPEPFQSDETHIDSATGTLFLTAIFQDMLSVLRTLLVNLSGLRQTPSPTLVMAWFDMMSRVSFFQGSSVPFTATLQCLTSIISLVVLDLPKVVAHLETLAEQTSLYPRLPDESYIHDQACVKRINTVLYGSAVQTQFVAAPALFAWSIITSVIRDVDRVQRDRRDQLQLDDSPALSEYRGRRASRRDSGDDSTLFGKLFIVLQDIDSEAEVADDPPAFFARTSVDQMGCFSVMSDLCRTITETYGSLWNQAPSVMARRALLGLVHMGMKIVEYGGPVVEALLTIMLPEVEGRSTHFDHIFATTVFENEDLFSLILEQALSRYPYELTPMLRLMTALTSMREAHTSQDVSNIVQALDNAQFFTVQAPDNFRSYALDHEDDNISGMKLTEPLPLFLSKSTLSHYGSRRTTETMELETIDKKNLLAIPSDTVGIFLKETRPYVFCLAHAHSALGYLGLLLSTELQSADVLVPPMYNNLDRATSAEIISLITALLTTCDGESGDLKEAQLVLDRFSLGLVEDKDIITVIADLMEVELLAHIEQSPQEGSLSLLTACADFFNQLITVAPERAWSTLASSSLLGLHGGGNAFAAVVGGSEVPLSRFPFLNACASLYSHLITDAVTGLVKRRTKVNKPSNRFDSPMSPVDATPERTMTTVISAFQVVMNDVWQSLSEWRFAVPVEKTKITIRILESFSQLMLATHGVGTGSGGISSLLMPSSASLLDAIAPQQSNGATMQPFLGVLTSSLGVDDDQLSSLDRAALKDQAISTLKFMAILIRTAKIVDDSGHRASIIVTQVLSGMSILASLLVAHHSFKAPLYTLFTELVQAAQQNPSEPLSLLGQLSPATAKDFLSTISHLDRPLCDIEVESTIWNTLSNVMGSKQQWFALFLLTGSLPKDRMRNDKDEHSPSLKARSLLAYSLERLSNIASIAPERAIAMLKFVSQAQNAWVWATSEVLSHPDFLKNAVEWLNNLQVPTRSPNIAEELLSANEHEMAAVLCNILAVSIHAEVEIGDKTLIKLLPSKLAFMRQHGVGVNAYKRSLHLNLRDNFAKRFPSCELSDFERTSANPAPFGRRYFYDLEFADKVLGHEAAWHGSLNGRNQGFSDEFARANVNLSLVESQVRLLRSWQILSTTLCECAGQDETLQGELAHVAAVCLRANADANLEQPGMYQVLSIRAEMAFLILSKLVSSKSSVPAMKSVLPAAWDLVRTSTVDYDVATSLEDVSYYRKMLQVLYLAVQPYVYMDARAATREPKATDGTKTEFVDPAVAACVVQMMMKLIAPGFRALCGSLHNSVKFVEPADFALITALLQAALAIPGVSAVHQQLAEVVASTSIVRGAASLYSWADQLAEPMHQDPIYGEIAISFLLSLSTIPSIAEQMALDGLLLQLSSANLSNYFRKTGGKGPFSEPRRMFVIWTEGFLPLCLNLLDAVGPPVTADVTSFLNSYPEQLQRASAALENREATRQNPHARAITLGVVSEAHSLCLIAEILASDIARGAAEGLDAADIPSLQYDHQKVGEDAAGLLRQKTSLASRIVPMGEREEMWMAGGDGVAGDNVLLGKIVNEINGVLKCSGKDH